MPIPNRHFALRARIAALERSRFDERRGASSKSEWTATPIGIGAIDTALPQGGISRGTFHEVAAVQGDIACLGEDAAAAGFCAILLSLLAQRKSGGRSVLWCLNAAATGRGGLPGGIYAPGLEIFGLRQEDLILTNARRDAETLWVAEEALRTPDLAGVVAEVDTIGLPASRRLQLAAEASGATAILLRPSGARLTPTAATTRWRIATLRAEAPSPIHPAKRPHWLLDLCRSRGGRPGSWTVTWNAGGKSLSLLPDLKVTDLSDMRGGTEPSFVRRVGTSHR